MSDTTVTPTATSTVAVTAGTAPATLTAAHVSWLQKAEQVFKEILAEGKVILGDVVQFLPEEEAVADVLVPGDAPIVAAAGAAATGLNDLTNANGAAQVVAGIQTVAAQIKATVAAASGSATSSDNGAASTDSGN